MAIFLRESDVQRLLPMTDAIQAVDLAFKEMGNGTGANGPRKRVGAGDYGLTIMSAALGGQKAAGFKVPGGGTMVFLYGDANQLLAIMEAGTLGAIRTGAASGVSAQYMARPESSTIGMVGSGRQAETQLTAVCAVRPVKAVRVYSRTRERLEAFCETMSTTTGAKVTPANSAKEAVQGCDIAIAITNVRTLEPVVLGDWLAPGMHVIAAGANSLTRRELDNEAVIRSDIIAVDDMEQAKIECADLVQPIQGGRLAWTQVIELGQIVAGKTPGRTSPSQITLFESQGVALEDVAAAAHVYQRAKAKGIGVPLPF